MKSRLTGLGRPWNPGDSAQQALERAIELNPDSAKSHYQLGMLLSRTGKQQDGHKELALAEKLEAEERTKSGQQLRIISPH